MQAFTQPPFTQPHRPFQPASNINFLSWSQPHFHEHVLTGIGASSAFTGAYLVQRTPALLVASGMTNDATLPCATKDPLTTQASPFAQIPSAKKRLFFECRQSSIDASPGKMDTQPHQTPAYATPSRCDWNTNVTQVDLQTDMSSPVRNGLHASSLSFKTPPTVARDHILHAPPSVQSPHVFTDPVAAPIRNNRFRDFRRNNSLGSDSENEDDSPRAFCSQVAGFNLGRSPLQEIDAPFLQSTTAASPKRRSGSGSNLCVCKLIDRFQEVSTGDENLGGFAEL